MSVEIALTHGDDNRAFFDALFNNPPWRLIVPAGTEDPNVDLAFGDATRREYQIWEGYLSASRLLLDQILERKWNSRLIFPAMFNLRHAIEVALKWHIRYAEGIVPKNAGHDLNILIAAFRQTAEGLDEDATYIDEYMIDVILELSAIDPRSITFRYSTELDGTPITISDGRWDLRRLCFAIDMLSLWFENLSDWIDVSGEDYQAMLREANCR